MNLIFNNFEMWLRELLIDGIMDNLTGLFDSVNTRVGSIVSSVKLFEGGSVRLFHGSFAPV